MAALRASLLRALWAGIAGARFAAADSGAALTAYAECTSYCAGFHRQSVAPCAWLRA